MAGARLTSPDREAFVTVSLSRDPASVSRLESKDAGQLLANEAFCRAQGVSRSSFERWRGLLSPATSGPDGSLESVAHRNDRPVASARSAEHRFIDAGEIGLGGSVGEPLEIRLDLGGGIVLTIRRG